MTDVITLVSEDVNSFVAAYLVAKKGIITRLIYFDTIPYTDQKTHDLIQKNYNRLFQKVAECIRSFHVVPFTRCLDEIQKRIDPNIIPFVIRRLQYRGESPGQAT